MASVYSLLATFQTRETPFVDLSDVQEPTDGFHDVSDLLAVFMGGPCENSHRLGQGFVSLG